MDYCGGIERLGFSQPLFVLQAQTKYDKLHHIFLGLSQLCHIHGCIIQEINEQIRDTAQFCFRYKEKANYLSFTYGQIASCFVQTEKYAHLLYKIYKCDIMLTEHGGYRMLSDGLSVLTAVGRIHR